MKKFISVLIFALIGFIIGYILFGEILGERIPIKNIFISDTDNFLGSFIDELAIKPIRQKILISSLVGGLIGYVISVLTSKKTEPKK